MNQIPKCQTCGRRPSERGHFNQLLRSMSHCPGALHDAADLGPAAVALLREWVTAEDGFSPGMRQSGPWSTSVRALLAAADAKPTRPNHADGCAMQRWRYLGTGYDRVRKCECGAEDHAPEVKP